MTMETFVTDYGYDDDGTFVEEGLHYLFTFWNDALTYQYSDIYCRYITVMRNDINSEKWSDDYYAMREFWPVSNDSNLLCESNLWKAYSESILGYYIMKK